ncbi:MAG: hypothetical protein KF884_09800 [Fimbriimonadaceae bacterium]|nr:hypothetical protein [Fimbriimonadaceae bacterium]QYK57840.1 MAG: hypothetical protein KF884_09800 [Fimbriimonadaceae bacterium]
MGVVLGVGLGVGLELEPVVVNHPEEHAFMVQADPATWRLYKNRLTASPVTGMSIRV